MIQVFKRRIHTFGAGGINNIGKSPRLCHMTTPWTRNAKARSTTHHPMGNNTDKLAKSLFTPCICFAGVDHVNKCLCLHMWASVFRATTSKY